MEEISQSAKNAKNILLSMLVMWLVLDIITVIVKHDGSGIARVLLTIALMWFTLEGYKWAKWVTIVCSLLGSGLGIIGGLTFISKSKMGIVLILMGIYLAAPALYLLLSRNLETYFTYKREKRKKL
jgi:hypothetical protein